VLVKLDISQSGSSPQPARSLEPIPATNVGFRELEEVAFHVPAGGPWTLRVDDAPLPATGGVWRWRPGFFAGEVTAELAGSDGSVAAAFRLDVAPDAAKLGRERFADLLREVIQEDPVLVLGEEPATLRMSTERPSDDPLLVHAQLARLRQYGPSFVHAVRQAARQPRTTLRRARAGVDLHRAHRVDLHSLRHIVRTNAAAVLVDDPELAGTVAGGTSIRVDVPVVERTEDCAANRCIAAELRLVQQRVRFVREALTTLAARSELSETRTSLLERLPHRLAVLEHLEGQLGQVLAESPWREVRRAEITSAGLIAVAADPIYARAHRMGWRALRVGVGASAKDDPVALSPTWELFERWCFVRLGRLLRERLPQLEWNRLPSHGHPSRATAGWEGHGNGTTVTLLLQPCFRSWDRSGESAFRSVSGERYPDLVLTYQSGGTRRFVVLDAKYTQSRRAILDQMVSAHLYRDALRWERERPALSMLVVPADPGADWLTREAFQRDEGVGAVVLGQTLPMVAWAALEGERFGR
jgi:hypothetical protein